MLRESLSIFFNFFTHYGIIKKIKRQEERTLSDKYKNNNNPNNIDDFFAKFDDPDVGKKRTASRASEQSRSSRSSATKRRSNQKKKTIKFNRSNSSSNGKTPVLHTIFVLGLAVVMAIGIYTGLLFLNAPEINTDDICKKYSLASTLDVYRTLLKAKKKLKIK